MTTAARAFINVPVRVTAVQWTGHNLAEVQAFLAPASPLYQPGAKRKKPMDDIAPLLQVNVRDNDADAQWAATGPHFKLQTVPLHGWIVKRSDTQELSVVDRDTFAASYEERLGDAGLAGGVATAFPANAPIAATHPRALTTSDARVEHSVSREPAADESGATIDRS